jgi:hypothetical protein
MKKLMFCLVFFGTACLHAQFIDKSEYKETTLFKYLERLTWVEARIHFKYSKARESLSGEAMKVFGNGITEDDYAFIQLKHKAAVYNKSRSTDEDDYGGRVFGEYMGAGAWYYFFHSAQEWPDLKYNQRVTIYFRTVLDTTSDHEVPYPVVDSIEYENIPDGYDRPWSQFILESETIDTRETDRTGLHGWYLEREHGGEYDHTYREIYIE